MMSQTLRGPVSGPQSLRDTIRYLRVVELLSYEQIADALNMSVEDVKARI
jgi:DNA-directed RNA polymerase specialized sigma24 family protein